MRYIHVLGYVLLFYLLFALFHSRQREYFRPLRGAYNRAHKAMRRRWRPQYRRFQQWWRPYKRMLR